MKSITGIEFNNPNICIAGNGNFACVCESCRKMMHEKMKRLSEILDLPDEQFTIELEKLKGGGKTNQP